MLTALSYTSSLEITKSTKSVVLQNFLPSKISIHPKYKTLKPFHNQSKLTEYRRSRWRNSKIEEQGLAYKDENLQSILHGGIDELLETADGKLVVLDYKTRALPPNTKII